MASPYSVGRAKIDSGRVAMVRAHAAAHHKGALTAASSSSTATFIDPTAVLNGARAITFGTQDYVAPFATFQPSAGGPSGSEVRATYRITSTFPARSP